MIFSMGKDVLVAIFADSMESEVYGDVCYVREQ